jgi:hypothetical protein
MKLADDAEMRLTQELQRMGQEAMQAWASAQVIAKQPFADGKEVVNHSLRQLSGSLLFGSCAAKASIQSTSVCKRKSQQQTFKIIRKNSGCGQQKMASIANFFGVTRSLFLIKKTNLFLPLFGR